MSLTMLADVVEVRVAVCIGPQPALRPVVPGAILVASRQVPEGDGDVFPSQPLPVVTILGVPHCAHPVLTAALAPAHQSVNQF